MIREFFHSITLRERFMAVIFVALLSLFWVDHLIGEYKAQSEIHKLLSNDLELQQIWLNSASEIEQNLKGSLAELNPQQTFNANQLAEKIDQIGRSLNINVETSTPFTDGREIFNVNSITVRANRVGIEDLILFDQEIKRESPYIALESIQLSRVRTDPYLLDATFIISSFELNAGSFTN